MPASALPRRFRRNVLATYLSTATSAVQVLVITPLLVHGLGPERYGIWALVWSFGLFAVLLELGLSSATVRYVAQYRELGQEPMLVRTVSASFWVLLGLGALALLVGVVLAPLVPVAFKAPGQEAATSVLVVLVAASIAAAIAGGAFQGCLAGLQRYSLLSMFAIGAAVAQTAAFALVISVGGGLVALGVALLAVSLAEQISRYIAVRRLAPQVTLSPRIFDRSFAKEIFRVSMWISSTHAATAIRYRIDTIVVGFVAGVQAAGVYAVGQLLFVAADRFIRPALTGFFPFSAELAGRRDAERLRGGMLTGTRVALAAAGPLCVSGIVLAKPALHAWVGAGYGEAHLVVVYLLAALLIATISRAGLLMLQGSGRIRGPAAIVWVEAIVNLALSIALGLVIGLSGVALATLIATVAVSTLIGIPYICRAFDLSVRRFLLPIAQAHVPAVGVALATGWILKPSENAGFPSVVAAGVAIGGSYLLILIFTGLSRDERRHVWDRIRRVDSRAVSEA
ncbi:MAG TPA: oligosaccharide flippase family protein [Gaiellaceae bacterium]|nr:oligosaccharide flippase family protein [Gaiellaceae bacterium]